MGKPINLGGFLYGEFENWVIIQCCLMNKIIAEAEPRLEAIKSARAFTQCLVCFMLLDSTHRFIPIYDPHPIVSFPASYLSRLCVYRCICAVETNVAERKLYGDQ